ncbi:MAG: tripartite tricarboxylate transporter permease [Haloferacaceae archaeon]
MFDVPVDPATTVSVLGYAGLGVALGTATGLTPGLHANAVALLLAAAASRLPGSGLGVAAALLATGVVHTFLDVVPALALGVPDAAMAASALPGHRLVLDGRGDEAVRLSACGSVAGVLAAVPLAVPLTRAARRLLPVLEGALPVVLGGVACYLVATESSVRAAVGGVAAFAASAGLGAVVLDRGVAGPLPVGSVLAPLFAGLFGAPILLESLRGDGGLPPQADAAIRMDRRSLGITATAGAVAGAAVAYVPGVSAGVAATVALPAAPGRHPARGYVVASSAANTATAVFALFALAGLDATRTGVTVAMAAAEAPVVLPVLLPAVALAAAAGMGLVVALGGRYLRAARHVDHARLAVGVLGLLAVLAYLFAGGTGVGVYLAASVVGLIPAAAGCRRVHLMGVLLGPLALGL